jgi:hypothetical protein
MPEYRKLVRIEIIKSAYSRQPLRISLSISASISSSLKRPAVLPSYRVEGIAAEPSMRNQISCPQHLNCPAEQSKVFHRPGFTSRLFHCPIKINPSMKAAPKLCASVPRGNMACRCRLRNRSRERTWHASPLDCGSGPSRDG